MKYIKTILILVVIATIGKYSCSNFDKSQDEKCFNRDSLEGFDPTLIFWGFKDSELSNITVNELRDNNLVDCFSATCENRSYDSSDLGVKLNFVLKHWKLKSTYQFFIPGYQTFTISNIESFQTIYGTNCGTIKACEFGTYVLNGKTHSFRDNHVLAMYIYKDSAKLIKQ